jgi:hypothetical protein
MNATCTSSKQQPVGRHPVRPWLAEALSATFPDWKSEVVALEIEYRRLIGKDGLFAKAEGLIEDESHNKIREGNLPHQQQPLRCRTISEGAASC